MVPETAVLWGKVFSRPEFRNKLYAVVFDEAVPLLPPLLPSPPFASPCKVVFY